MSQVARQETTAGETAAAFTEFVTFTVGGYMFGVPVLRVQDTLIPDRIATVPLAPPEVRGSINLRGRIVTMIDMRRRLRLPEAGRPKGNGMGVTVEFGLGAVYAARRQRRRCHHLADSTCARPTQTPWTHCGASWLAEPIGSRTA